MLVFISSTEQRYFNRAYATMQQKNEPDEVIELARSDKQNGDRERMWVLPLWLRLMFTMSHSWNLSRDHRLVNIRRNEMR